MASSLADAPPFPEELPQAPIERVSSRKLLDQDVDELARVLETCRTQGFFYLNLQDSPQGTQLLDEARRLLSLSQEAFRLPLEEKMRYVLRRDGSLFGYKKAGTVKQTDRDRRPDTTEFFNVGKDHLHGVTASRDYPPILKDNQALLQDFSKHCHECGLVVLRALARQLDLPQHTFADLNVFGMPSGDHIRLTHTIPLASDKKIGLASHTDFGSVTILFNWLGGLQIESQTGKEWLWVKPLAGHAIINLGDAMVIFTNGTLRSAKHRVVPAPGDQRHLDRYSVVYFVRPHDAALMKPVHKFDTGGHVRAGGKFSIGLDANEVLTAKDWMEKRTIQMIGR